MDGILDPAEKRRIDEILLTCKRNAEELEEEQKTLNDEASKNNVLVKEQKAILVCFLLCAEKES
jgi:hypothetical protein